MKTPFAAVTLLALAVSFGLLVGVDRTEAQNAAWGSVKGQVVYGGEKLPEPRTLDVNKDQAHCLAKGPIHSEEWVVNKDNKGVRWAFVWLQPQNMADKMPIHPNLLKPKAKEVIMDQPICRFEPHALALREGQTLIVKNSAPIAHNVNWIGHPLKNPGNNVIVPPGQQQVITGLKADRFPVTISCNIHPWMKAYTRIYDHPYFAVTDADGKFEFKDAPAGTYRLMSWHEAIGYGPGAREGVPVTIKAGATTDAGKLEIK